MAWFLLYSLLRRAFSLRMRSSSSPFSEDAEIAGLPLIRHSGQLGGCEAAIRQTACCLELGRTRPTRFKKRVTASEPYPTRLRVGRSGRERTSLSRVKPRPYRLECAFVLVGRFTFGSIEIDGTRYDSDVVIDRGRVRKRKKGPSKSPAEFRAHSSLAEEIPWQCRRLVVGSGADGALPVMEEVATEARRRHVGLVVAPTAQALKELEAGRGLILSSN